MEAQKKTSNNTVSMSPEQVRQRVIAFARRIANGPKGEKPSEIMRKAHVSGVTFSALKHAQLFEQKGGKFIFAGPLQIALAAKQFEEAARIILDAREVYNSFLVEERKKRAIATPGSEAPVSVQGVKLELPFHGGQNDKDLKGTAKDQPVPEVDIVYNYSNGERTVEAVERKGIPLTSTYKTKPEGYPVVISKDAYYHAIAFCISQGRVLADVVDEAVFFFLADHLSKKAGR
jgi:hypothetical protein